MEEKIKTYLPNGWEEAARREGAIVRSRQIKTAEDLLQLNMLYLTDIGSYQGASIAMMLTRDIHLNREATRKRIQGSWKWLKWMSRQLSKEQGYVVEQPEWLEERRVVLVDASDVSLRGSKTSDWRLHYAFDLFSHTCTQFELTAIAEGGEKLRRYKAKPGDIVIGDRIYGTIKGLEYIREQGAGYIYRAAQEQGVYTVRCPGRADGANIPIKSTRAMGAAIGELLL